jgi:hypothetical protein
MATPKFSNKDPQETVLISFDFSNLFVDTAEAISSVVWSVETFSGTDASPNAILSGNGSFNASITSHLITAGLNGVTYHIHAIATTNKQILKLTGSMLMSTQ